MYIASSRLTTKKVLKKPTTDMLTKGEKTIIKC
jgi:hypothetical protein